MKVSSVSLNLGSEEREETPLDLSKIYVGEKAPLLEPQSYVSEFIDQCNPELNWKPKEPKEYNPPEHSINRFLITLAGTKSEHTQRACATDIYSAVRDFFFIHFDLPSPEFDDIAALAIGAKVCCEADRLSTNKKLPKNFKKQLDTVLSQELIPSARSPKQSTSLQDFIPGFSFERKNGRLKMRLEPGKAKKILSPEIRHRDKAFIDILLQKIEDSGRSLWPHFFKQEVIGANLALCKNERKNSGATISRRIVFLRKFEDDLRDLDILTTRKPVMSTIAQPRKEKKLQPSFLPEEMVKILTYLDNKCSNIIDVQEEWKTVRNRAMIQLLDSTLLRNNAICSVHLANINLNKKTVLIKNEKGKKDRYLQLTDSAVEALSDYLKIRKKYIKKDIINNKDFPYLFCTRSGKQFNHRDFGRLISTTAELAGVPNPPSGNWGPHSWRRGLAAQIYKESHGDIAMVQTLLGHEDSKTTLDYIRPALERVRAELHELHHPRA